MNAPVAAAATVPSVAGTAYAGGIYAGRFFVGAQPYALVVAPAAVGEIESKWGKLASLPAAESYNDGVANTQAMLAAGSPLATWARGLRIDGFDDWYLPSRAELLQVYGELQGTPANDFARDWYWTSTQDAGDDEYAWYQRFLTGDQYCLHKGVQLRARAVRRVPI